MSNFFKISFAIITLTLFACSGNVEKVRKSQLIPPRDVVSILTDLYIADGLLAYPPVRVLYSKKDSTASYIEIIEKHGYTKELMDKTIRYYFINDPKKLEKMYDEVLAGLSEIQSRLEAKTPAVIPANTSDLWTANNSYSVPDDGVNNPVYFSIPVKDTGLYELSMITVVYPDDQSMNPRINVFFWHADNSETGVRDYWTSMKLPKDGIRQNYILSKRLTDTAFTHFNGWLLYSDPQTGQWYKHAIIENITLKKITKE
jgi:hypothetical protein